MLVIYRRAELPRTRQANAADVLGPQVDNTDANKADKLKSVNERSLINQSWLKKWHDEHSGNTAVYSLLNEVSLVCFLC